VETLAKELGQALSVGQEPALHALHHQMGLVLECAKRLIASIKFDLPDPFGPISTFEPRKGRAAESGPKESRFVRWISRIIFVEPS
jgi:hypothetical protein